MPFIHIKSLPFDPPLPVAALLEGISRDFSRATGIAIAHVTATWELPAGRPLRRGRPGGVHAARRLPPGAGGSAGPDFNDADEIGGMLRAVAASIAQRANLPIGNSFVNHRPAHAGAVFDAGDIVHW